VLNVGDGIVVTTPVKTPGWATAFCSMLFQYIGQRFSGVEFRRTLIADAGAVIGR
jgi:hypothetical protein